MRFCGDDQCGPREQKFLLSGCSTNLSRGAKVLRSEREGNHSFGSRCNIRGFEQTGGRFYDRAYTAIPSWYALKKLDGVPNFRRRFALGHHDPARLGDGQCTHVVLKPRAAASIDAHEKETVSAECRAHFHGVFPSASLASWQHGVLPIEN